MTLIHIKSVHQRCAAAQLCFGGTHSEFLKCFSLVGCKELFAVETWIADHDAQWELWGLARHPHFLLLPKTCKKEDFFQDIMQKYNISQKRKKEFPSYSYLCSNLSASRMHFYKSHCEQKYEIGKKMFRSVHSGHLFTFWSNFYWHVDKRISLEWVDHHVMFHRSFDYVCEAGPPPKKIISSASSLKIPQREQIQEDEWLKLSWPHQKQICKVQYSSCTS